MHRIKENKSLRKKNIETLGGMGSGTPMPVLLGQAKQHGHVSTPAHATH
jgi:hypothetical protein